MRHSTRFAVPVYRNPSFLPGAVAVMALLLERNYAQNYREAIGRYASIHGELSGAVDAGLLDREDLETAEAVFVDALEPVPGDSPAWQAPDVYLDVDSLLEPRGAVPIGPPDGFHEALARFEQSHPVRDPLPASFHTPDAWQQLGGDFPAVPGPIRGGSPDAGRHAPESLEAVSVALYGVNPYA